MMYKYIQRHRYLFSLTLCPPLLSHPVSFLLFLLKTPQLFSSFVKIYQVKDNWCLQALAHD